MTDDGARTGPVPDLRLTEDDAVVAALLGYRMVAADVAANRAARDRGARVETRDMALGELIDRLGAPSATAAPWRHALAARLAGAPSCAHRAAVVEGAAQQATAHVPGRARRLAVLVELATADPWPVGVEWAPEARVRTLEAVVEAFDDVTRRDLVGIERERYATTIRPRTRLSIPEPRAAGSGRIGAPVRPAIGVAVGVAAPAVARYWRRVARDATRVALHARVVLLGEYGDLDAARRATALLAARRDEVTVRLIGLVTRLADPHTCDRDRSERLAVEYGQALAAEQALQAAVARLGPAVDGRSR